MYDRMEELGLIWDRWDVRTVQYKDNMEGSVTEGTISGAPPLALEVQKMAVSSGCHHFHRQYGGYGVFVSVQQKQMLHTNPNCKIAQDITNSMYNLFLIHNITNHMKSENTPRKNPQNTADI